MKKLLAFVLVLVMLLSFAACGGEKTIDLAAAKEAIVNDLQVEGALELPAERLEGLYGITADQVKSSACFITMGGTFPDEVVMVEAVDSSAASDIAKKLGARLEEIKSQSQNYDAENFALLEKVEVLQKGNYVALFISPKTQEMKKIFESSAK